MSKRYRGGFITSTPTIPTSSSAQGIWTKDQAANYKKENFWPTSPGIPSIGSVTSGANNVTVSYTVPSCIGSTCIVAYTAISSPGCITGSICSSYTSVTVFGLNPGTAYTFKVNATNGAGVSAYSSSSASVTTPNFPGAPTGVTATANANSLSVSVAFTAPSSNGGSAITNYTVTSTPGCLTVTGTISPFLISGSANTAYTYKVRAQNAVGCGPCSSSSNSVRTPNLGSQSYLTAGTYTWVAPAGVSNVSVVMVGAGGGGGGGSTSTYSSGGGGGGGTLAYRNNITVTPGCSYTVVVGAGGTLGNIFGQSGGCGGSTYFINTSTIGVVGSYGGGGNGGSGGTVPGATGSGVTYNAGGHGGCGGFTSAGGGGAGGYYAPGGTGASSGGYATAGQTTCGKGGGGGGGAGGYNGSNNICYGGGGGGGTGLCGYSGITAVTGSAGTGIGGGGKGGSFTGGNGGNGTGGTGHCNYGTGGSPGGGGGGGNGYSSTYYKRGSAGASGGVRIIWPGNTRSFPATNTGGP